MSILTTEMADLFELHCLGELSPEEANRLETMVSADDELCRHYIRFMYMHALAERLEDADVEQDWPMSAPPDFDFAVAPDAIPSLPPIQLLGAPIQGSVGSFSSGWPLAYLLATVLVGIGLLAGALMHVSQPLQFAYDQKGTGSFRQNGPEDVSCKPNLYPPSQFVGRITGMVDCQWSDPNTAVPGPVAVPLGRKYALSSGLMEITYDTGAKVILQGPCTYEVESKTGGFLSLGKLTARVEKKAEVEEERSASRSSFLIPHSYFAVRTPTATVTDLGTEFGVEVKEDQTTEISVLQGVVETEQISRSGMRGDKRRMVAGEAARCVPDQKSIASIPFHAETFALPMEDSGEFTGLRLSKRWTFDTPNAGNRWSLTARPGFLRIRLFNAGQDSWEDRGTSPMLFASSSSPADHVVMETFVDLATANGGKPIEQTMGGLVVYDAATNRLALILGLAHNAQSYVPTYPLREVALQSPGQRDFFRIPVELDSACLRLQRDGASWVAYYKANTDQPWQVIGTVAESEFATEGHSDLRIGLFAKSFNHVAPGGRGASIDFDYFRVESPPSEQPSEQELPAREWENASGMK